MRAPLVAIMLVLASFGIASANHPQSAGSHSMSFDHRTGNEWWVEVIATGSPVRVEARDDGGAWTSLTLKSWGAWAASFHIEPGHRVQFRASWSDGASVESCWFTHPAGVEECGGTTPPPPPPPSTGTFAFAHGGGNEYWVEAKVSPKPAAVEAMDTGGAWTPLAFKSWGEWAASLRVEPGHDVRFRAHNGNGVWQVSCWFSHPAGAQRSCDSTQPPAWPREGSYVKYQGGRSESYGESYQSETEMNVTYRYAGGQWSRTCEGWSRVWIGYGEDQRYNETRHEETLVVGGPPKVAGTPRPGEDASVPGVGCVSSGTSGTVFGPVRQSATRNGTAVSVVTYYVEYHPIWPAYYGGSWDAATNLVLGWGFGGSHSGQWGSLVDTDAPLTTQAPARASWPFEGSFALYRMNETGGGSATLDYRFRDGGWSLTCTRYEADGTFAQSDVTGAGPVHGPTAGFAVGSQLEIPLPDAWCHSRWNDLLVERTQSVTTTRNGASYKAKVWYADEDDSWTGVDFDAWWDTKTGLYLEWDHNEVQGKLVNTDAPLAPG